MSSMPSVHMAVCNCYLYVICKEILEAHWNTSLHHLVSFLFRSNIPVAERRVVLMLCIFFKAWQFFQMLSKLFFYECWKPGKSNRTVSIWCKFWYPLTRCSVYQYPGFSPMWPCKQSDGTTGVFKHSVLLLCAFSTSELILPPIAKCLWNQSQCYYYCC